MHRKLDSFSSQNNLVINVIMYEKKRIIADNKIIDDNKIVDDFTGKKECMILKNKICNSILYNFL